jgi:ATP-dependent helicase/nuclease subunit A
MRQPSLFDAARAATDPAALPPPPDQDARDFAVDPAHHVVLEASAGTGKTRVLVDRYVRLLEAGVDPRHILAITFTRKAAAEMRERVLAEVRRRGEGGTWSAKQWQAIRGRITQIEISTIDAFCFGLLREFPLEADVDPGFDIADETEVGRFANEALDLTFRIARPLLAGDESLRLLFVRVKQPVLRDALARLLDRRHVALPAVASFVARHRNAGSADEMCARFWRRMRAEALEPDARRAALIVDGPHGAREFGVVAAELARLQAVDRIAPEHLQAFRSRMERYFLTQAGAPRQRLSRPYLATHFRGPDAKRRHEQALAVASPGIKAAVDALDADLDVLLARGLERMLVLTIAQFNRLLEEHALLDFAGMLDRAVALLERQEEFSRSRLKLQSRYHHLLIDEFQDTSRRQWRLIDLLIEAWAEGEGTADTPTSIFVVGDRKQSIYRFRHAEVTLLDEAARRIGLLRPGTRVRHAITTSFRAVPELLAFVNTLSSSLQGDGALDDRWRYDDTDRFPVLEIGPGARRDGAPVLGLVAEPSMAQAAAAVADEIAALVGRVLVRDRTSSPRPARPDDIAILFRSRAGHQLFEDALEGRGIRTYVYKGLGFFDAPEVQDLQALIRYIAQPDADLRAAELLRSRFIRLSDPGLVRLAPGFASALLSTALDPGGMGLSAVDEELLRRARANIPRWLEMADRMPPGEVVDRVLRESAYVFEMRGRRLDQARENVKKVRALVRRVENRGYTTFGRLASYFESLRLGDDSNAVIEAVGAVNLMTIHAAKGLEFPIVFVVNLHMGSKGRPPGVSVIERGPSGESDVSFGSSAATALEEARDTEELRRLLYVAVTRARDRLYVAAQVEKDGRVRRAQRSLASLLPATLIQTIGAAAAVEPGSPSEVSWVHDDQTFAFRVCRPAEAAAVAETSPPGHQDPSVPTGVPELLAVEDRRVSVSAAVPSSALAPVPGAMPLSLPVPAPEPEPVPWRRGGHDERLLGTLVHRMFARRIDPASAADPASLVRACLTADEAVDVTDLDGLGTEVLALYTALRTDGELTTLLGSGTCLYEVPFSYRPPDRPADVVRGVIDCLVVTTQGIVVVELKTGSPRPQHAAQTELYRRAIADVSDGISVEARIYYPKTSPPPPLG